MRLTRVLLTLACALGLTSQNLWGQTAGDWRFAHPQATLVGGLRASALLQSPLLKTALDQAAVKDPQVGMAMAIAQNMLRGVTEIRFSLMDNGSPTPDVLILVSGTLEPTTLALLQGQGQAQGPAKMETYSVDANTLLMGTGASLQAATARMSQAASPAEMQSVAFLQAGQITAGHDLWIAGKIPDIPGASLPLGLNLNLRGFAVGMSFTDAIGLEVAAQTNTADQAEALVKMIRDAEAKQPLGTVGVRPELSVNGTTARLRVSVPIDQVMQAMQNPALAGLMGGTTPAQPTDPVRPLAPPPKPSKPIRGTVIIQGLESGTLEIPIEVTPRP
jgi:hypothetical protein